VGNLGTITTVPVAVIYEEYAPLDNKNKLILPEPEPTKQELEIMRLKEEAKRPNLRTNPLVPVIMPSGSNEDYYNKFGDR